MDPDISDECKSKCGRIRHPTHEHCCLKCKTTTGTSHMDNCKERCMAAHNNILEMQIEDNKRFNEYRHDADDVGFYKIGNWTQLFKILQNVMQVPEVDREDLGIGADVKKRDPNRLPYDDLELVQAWRIHNPRLDQVYHLTQNKIDSEMKVGGKYWEKMTGAMPKVTTKLDKQCEALGVSVLEGVNEKWLLHGLKKENIMTACKSGLNERYADGMLGKCIYLAEDAVKIDQYTTVDVAPSSTCKYLHDKLYRNDEVDAEHAHLLHPGRVCYALLVRATLGFPIETKDAITDAHYCANGEPIFAFENAELRHIVGSVPNIPCHSVIVKAGPAKDGFKVVRFREFGIFHGETILPTYLIAYRRFLRGRNFYEGGGGGAAISPHESIAVPTIRGRRERDLADLEQDHKKLQASLRASKKQRLDLARDLQRCDGINGYRLTLLLDGSDVLVLQALRNMFKVPDKHNLGVGRDAGEHELYGDLVFQHAWKIDRKIAEKFYNGRKKQITSEIKHAGNFWQAVWDGQSSKVSTKIDDLPGVQDLYKKLGLNEDINEKLLLHGTSPENVPLILRNGFNERFSKGLLGCGIYLAEDPSKIDQYTHIDRAPSENLQLLHEQLYDGSTHTGKVFYAFVSRAVLGFPVYTLDGATVKNDPSMSVFAGDPTKKRELSHIPGSIPGTSYHSLICEVGGVLARHREFCVYHAHNILPEYLVSYRRVPTRLIPAAAV